MNATLRRVTSAEFSRLRTDAVYVAELTVGRIPVGMGSVDDTLGSLPWWMRWGFRILLRKQVRALRKAEKVALSPGQAGPASDCLELHKDWHGLHWLLCQSDWEGPEPLRYAIFGKEPVGEDGGYGQAHLVEPAMVREIAALLERLDAGSLMTRYDAKAMESAEIYPGGWSRDSSWRRSLLVSYQKLTRFYAETAAQGQGILVWMA